MPAASRHALVYLVSSDMSRYTATYPYRSTAAVASLTRQLRGRHQRPTTSLGERICATSRSHRRLPLAGGSSAMTCPLNGSQAFGTSPLSGERTTRPLRMRTSGASPAIPSRWHMIPAPCIHPGTERGRWASAARMEMPLERREERPVIQQSVHARQFAWQPQQLFRKRDSPTSPIAFGTNIRGCRPARKRKDRESSGGLNCLAMTVLRPPVPTLPRRSTSGGLDANRSGTALPG